MKKKRAEKADRRNVMRCQGLDVGLFCGREEAGFSTLLDLTIFGQTVRYAGITHR